MEPEAYDSFTDPFVAHLILILSIYELGLPRAPIPRYDGPSTWQTDNILRVLETISNRMYTAEDTLAFIKASENWENNLDVKNRHGSGDTPQPSNPSAESSQGSLSSAPPFPPFNVTTSLKTSSSSGTPLVVPPGPLSNTAFETDKSAVDELRLVKAQVSDVFRVCNAIARGDLSNKITVPVQGAFMVQVKDAINGMVDKLVQCAKEVSRISQEFGTHFISGGHACMDGVQGTWAELTINLNKMASNTTNQMRSISEVTKAVAMGDLSKRIQVDAQGEMLDLKMTVTRVSLQVGTEGILGGQATVPDVQGIWKVLTDNVNLMAMNMTNQVRSVAEVAKAVTSGDLTKAIEVDVRGELLDLNKAVNGMTESLSDFAKEVTRVLTTVSPVAPTNDVKFDILFAEDNLVNQKVVVKILLKYGHTVEIVENGSLAVDAFKARVGRNRPFDIILTNDSLPIMGGMEATELIRAYETHNNLTPTPIIAVTAHTMIGDRERYLDAGMDDHIARFLRRGDLLILIAKYAGERARQRGHPIPVDVP